MVRLAQTLAITKFANTRPVELFMAHISANQIIATLRHRLDVSSWWALRAVAHSAESVQSVAAQSAARRALRLSTVIGPEFPSRTVSANTIHPGSAISCFGKRSLLANVWMQTAPTPFVPSLNTARLHRNSNSTNSLGCVFHQLLPQPPSGSALRQLQPERALANRSLNRTRCGMPPFAPPFHSGSNAVTPQRAG